MHLTITNTGAEPETLTTPDGSVAAVLHTHQPYQLNQEAVQVLILGDKPEVRDVLRQAAQALGEVVRKLVELIAGRRQHARDAGGAETITMAVANHGANPVRAVLGDGVTEQTVAPGTTSALQADGYIELRELGVLPDYSEAAQPEAP